MRKVCLIKNTLKCCDMPSVYSLLEQDISNSQWNKLAQLTRMPDEDA